MSSETPERLELESKLRMALEERQFVLHYQGVINRGTRCIAGAPGPPGRTHLR